jgi:hypothetical protein
LPLSERAAQALARVRGRSIWWFVALAVLLALLPVSTPVLIGVYALMAVAFWIPLLRNAGRAFRRGYRDDREDRD